MDKKALLEAALFVSDKAISLGQLANIISGTADETKQLIEKLQADYLKPERGVELVETPEGYEFRIKSEYRDKVATLAPFSDLGEGMLRTLAIVTVNQPVKQSVIVHYQGNKAYGYIEELENKGLVKSEKFGRTKLVNTTDDFEKYFGKSTDDLKKMLKGEKKETKEEKKTNV
jgi:segregation and condensation protein B